MTNQNLDTERLKNIFFPHYNEKCKLVKDENSKFAYYTSSEVAFQILKNKEIWLRNAMLMNDYMEVEYGLNAIRTAIDSEVGVSFKEAINDLHPNLFQDIENQFKAWIPGMKLDTFITCFSEHLSSEDATGRLSMWRAYGGRSGVAFVFNSMPMFLSTSALASYTSPVAYFNQDEMNSQLAQITINIKKEAKYLSGLDKNFVRSVVFNMLRFAALCNKHQGFKEEREWRVISSPSIQLSHLVPESVELVRGMPQSVLKIKLKDYPEQGIVGLEIPQFLDKIIIGPCEFPKVLFRSFAKLLGEAGVKDPASKIITSNIPLRHNY